MIAVSVAVAVDVAALAQTLHQTLLPNHLPASWSMQQLVLMEWQLQLSLGRQRLERDLRCTLEEEEQLRGKKKHKE